MHCHVNKWWKHAKNRQGQKGEEFNIKILAFTIDVTGSTLQHLKQQQLAIAALTLLFSSHAQTWTSTESLASSLKNTIWGSAEEVQESAIEREMG